MIVTFQSEDEQEIKRLAKANDMAQFIWELVHNGWRDFKHTDYDYQPAWDKINELLEQYKINIDDLTS
jgi:replication initiation and membrane attachment protein DnaB